MESVKRYNDYDVGMCEWPDGHWVKSEDFDRVSAENLALQQRLTVQDQRVDDLVELLQRVLDSSVLSFEMDAPEPLENLEADICAALKTTVEPVVLDFKMIGIEPMPPMEYDEP